MSARRPGVGVYTVALSVLLSVPVAEARPPGESAEFTAIEPATLEDAEYYSAARFPDMGGSAFHPDADLPAPVRAVLLVDAEEPALAHARYRVRHDLVAPTTEGGEPRAYVEVVRFNLGPVIREDLATQDPALPLAPLEAFGTGPHVAYRFTMGAVQGIQASVLEAERREVRADEAGAMDCLGAPCLNPSANPGPDGDWRRVGAALPPLPFASGTAGAAMPAAVLAVLHEALGEDARLPIPRADAPRIEFVLDQDLQGQEQTRHGLARNAVVLDDDIGSVWARWRAVGPDHADAAMHEVPR